MISSFIDSCVSVSCTDDDDDDYDDDDNDDDDDDLPVLATPAADVTLTTEGEDDLHESKLLMLTTLTMMRKLLIPYFLSIAWKARHSQNVLFMFVETISL